MIYAMSDIHGCLRELKDKMDQVDLQGDNRLIFLGDYMDYGINSFKVLQYIWELQKNYGDEKVIVLKGNHEQMFLDWINDFRNPYADGSVESILFYEWLETDFEHGANTLRTFISEEQINFLKQIARTCSWESISREAVQMILSDHDEMIWWMQHLPLYYEAEMAIQFCEIKKYIARNERISICLEDGSYDNYLMISDIPEGKYDNLYVYGIGTVDVEFSKDMYAAPSQLEKMVISPKHDMMAPAIEIVLHKDPRDIERCEERCMLFKDLKNYLQIGRNFSVVNRKDWSEEAYEWRKDILSKYDNDDEPRKDVQKTKSFFKHVDGLYFLVFTADEWNHDADEWLGIYIDKKSAREAYDRAVAYYEEERSRGRYSKAQRVVMTEFILEDDRFREVKREELED